MQAARFEELEVLAVDRLTEDSVRVTFDVPPELVAAYEHVPGQHIAVRTVIGGSSVVRSYSVCSRAGAGVLQIGIKHLAGGSFSSFANLDLKEGDSLDVAPPVGDFVLRTDPSNRNHYVAIVAGSGITPAMAMIESVLADEPDSRFTLVYGNRDGRSVMFLDDLGRLKNHHVDRFAMFHVLSREEMSVDLFSGRLDEEKISALLTTVVDVASATDWFLCGPSGVVEAAKVVLAGAGVDSERVHDELFYATDGGSRGTSPDDVVGSLVGVTLDGRRSELVVDPDGEPILDHVLAVRPEAPFACRAGACASCRATVTAGEVRMDRNWSLDEGQVERGQILTCQAHPISSVVELTYDI